jgi:hypothetical protein
MLPHQPVEALLWVLSVESGCELRVFESVPGKPTMQVATRCSRFGFLALRARRRGSDGSCRRSLSRSLPSNASSWDQLSRFLGAAAAATACRHCALHAHVRCRQFKYYAKDFGDNEVERLMTLARLMGDKGDCLRKVILPSLSYSPPHL